MGSDIRYFDLYPSKVLCFTFPLTKEEYETKGENGRRDPGYDDFECIGMRSALNGNRHVLWHNDWESIPKDLKEYVAVYRKHVRGKWEERPGIAFAKSGMLEAPTFVRNEWHVGTHVPNQFASLQPPGWYSGRKIVNGEGINHIVAVDRDPGECVVCHGKSGERRHVGVLYFGPDAMPVNQVCRACAPKTFQQWQAILDSDEVLPTVIPFKAAEK
jgi:hypothetical protein